MKTTDALLSALRAEILDVVRAELRRHEGDTGADWIDQSKSPLGRKLHCRLVRDGLLPGAKVHRRILVRRRDLDAYVEAHPAPTRTASDGDDLDHALARVGARLVPRA